MPQNAAGMRTDPPMSEPTASGPNPAGYDAGYDTDPNNPDTDGDGTLDASDPNPLLAVIPGVDSDGDGVGDQVEGLVSSDANVANTKVLFVSGKYGSDGDDGSNWGHALQTTTEAIVRLDALPSYPGSAADQYFVLYDQTSLSSPFEAPGGLFLAGAPRQNVAFVGGLRPGLWEPGEAGTPFRVASGRVAEISSATGITLGGVEIASFPLEPLRKALAGFPFGEGEWLLSRTDLDGLTVSVSRTHADDFSPHVTAFYEDTSGAVTSYDKAPFEAVPVFGQGTGAAGADQPIPLDVSIAVAGLGAGDILYDVTVTGVPDGAKLTAGIDNGDGSWTLLPGQLDKHRHLLLTEPSHLAQSRSLHTR